MHRIKLNVVDLFYEGNLLWNKGEITKAGRVEMGDSNIQKALKGSSKSGNLSI